MIKWFEGNPLAVVLGAICGLLLLSALLLGIVWSFPPSVPDDGAERAAEDLVLEVPELPENEPIEAYAVIIERPAFNETRQPVIEDGSADEIGEELAEEEVDAPEFELAGVVITPSIRMVTLREQGNTESLVAFEGQPLEGNYGTWKVSRIEPRQITLSSGAGEEVELKLLVHDATIEAPPKPAARESSRPESGAQADNEDPDQPLTRAEEIRQRIAERREELRRAAEENAQVEDQSEEVDYQSAIQSMMNGQRRDNNEN